MPTALFLASTPLHTFWSLGLIRGAFADWQCHLVLIDQREQDTDFIAEAAGLEGISVQRFGQIGKRPLDKLRRARPTLAAVRSFASTLNPTYIAVGNDRRIEFHAAIAAAPGAIGAYVDDGLFSYLPMKTARPWLEPLAACGRRLAYGVPSEHPRFVGGSAAVQEAWVMLPEQVHEGLRHKTLRRIEPEWFQDRLVQAVCARAIEQAGVDVSRVRAARLLLVLPHESFLRTHPRLRDQLQSLLHEAERQEQAVLVKRHPRSASTPLSWGPMVTEIPKRLPVEVLSPLLSHTLVVGSLSTALLSLRLLGQGLDVRYLDDPGQAGQQALPVYQAGGVQPLRNAQSGPN